MCSRALCRASVSGYRSRLLYRETAHAILLFKWQFKLAYLATPLRAFEHNQPSRSWSSFAYLSVAGFAAKVYHKFQRLYKKSPALSECPFNGLQFVQNQLAGFFRPAGFRI
jgi:hypothetical protein